MKKLPRREFTKTYHIIFDVFGANTKMLDSEKFVFELLMEIPPLVDMKILSGPNVVRDYDDGHQGVSAFEIIDFSHISIHTFVDTKEAFVDIFSCRPYDYEKVRDYLYKKFKVSTKQVETLEVKYHFEK